MKLSNKLLPTLENYLAYDLCLILRMIATVVRASPMANAVVRPRTVIAAQVIQPASAATNY